MTTLAVLDAVLPDVTQRADLNPAAVYLARLAPTGRRTMLHGLNVIADMLAPGSTAETFPWPQLRYAHTQAVRTALAERYAHTTANVRLSALRGVLKESWRLGLMSAEDYARAVDLERVRGTSLPAGRALEPAEIRALVDVCAADPTAAGPRDAALIALLYATGLRRSEAVAVDLADVDHSTGAVHVRRGKGRKDRMVYLTNGAQAAVAAWVHARGAEPGPLLCPVDQCGVVTVRAISGQAVMHALAKRVRQAAIRHCSPHDLRRTFAGDALDAGVDLSIVQQLLGHSSPLTTARYDRRPERVKRDSASRVFFPYAGQVAGASS